MSDHFSVINYDIYNNNNYLFFSVSGLGDLILLYSVISSICKYREDIVYDIVVRKDHEDFIKYILPKANVFFAYPEEEHGLEEYYNLSVIKKNNIIFFNKKHIILNSVYYMIDTEFKNMVFSIDDCSFNINDDIINTIYNTFNINRNDNIVTISLTSHGFEKSINIENIHNIINYLINNGYFVINLSPCVYFNSDRFINLYYKIRPVTLAHIIYLSKFLITVDTGPMHIASITRTPFCAFFNITYSRSVLDYVYNSNWKNFRCYDIGIKENIILEKVEEFKNECIL